MGRYNLDNHSGSAEESAVVDWCLVVVLERLLVDVFGAQGLPVWGWVWQSRLGELALLVVLLVAFCYTNALSLFLVCVLCLVGHNVRERQVGFC